MRQRGIVVAREYISNCALATTLASFLACLVKPDFDSLGATIALIAASCLASGAAHGLAAAALGQALFGKDIGPFDLTSRDEALPSRLFSIAFAAVFLSVRSAVAWGMAVSPVVAIAYSAIVDNVARFAAPDRPWWLVAIGFVSGLVAGRLAVWLMKRAARDNRTTWTASSLSMFYRSNWGMLAQARRRKSHPQAAGAPPHSDGRAVSESNPT